MSTSNTPAAPGKTAANIVHEAIDERQYVRTRMNARVRMAGAGREPFEADLADISLGGIGLLHETPLTVGALYDASIQLRLNQVDLSIDGKVRIVSQRGKEVGAQFVDLDAQKRDILRYLISAYLSGEIADINGLFNVMQRENYIKERKHK
ncbi:PilZ domain-containing protein, partial [Pseudomonas sp. GD03867]